MTRVLPAKVYDALQLSALMYGGIGAGVYTVVNTEVPVCMLGHLGARPNEATTPEAMTMMTRLGFAIWDNDRAVKAINRRKGIPETLLSAFEPRVTFEEWCAELGIVRGPEELSPVSELRAQHAIVAVAGVSSGEPRET